MKQEKSCGCVVIDKDKVLLVKHVLGHWDFPKGHMEKGETEKETAIREIKEETNIDVKIISEDTWKVAYSPEEGIWKEVMYFLAEKIQGEERPQEEEVGMVKWVSIQEAMEILTFSNTKKVLQKIIEKYLFKK